MSEENNHKISKSAFALIELLVAVSIFAIVITVVYSTLFIGIKTYHRIQAELKLNQDINRVLDRLSVELRNCYDAEYDEQEEEGRFIASSQSLSFFTIKNDYSQESYPRLLARVSYSFRDGNLFKKSQIDKDAFLEEENFAEEELLSDIQTFSIEYLYYKKEYFEEEYKFEWMSEWTDRTLVPQGISIEITKLDSKNNISASLQRHIFLQQGEIGVQQ